MLNYISRKAAINNIIPGFGKFVDRFPDGGRRRGKKEISATFVAREEKGKRVTSAPSWDGNERIRAKTKA